MHALGVVLQGACCFFLRASDAPAQEVTRAGLRLLLNGDASQWDRAMQMPHYNTHSMPAVSLHTGAHLIQVCSLLVFPARGVRCTRL